jgi:hypothetical protein
LLKGAQKESLFLTRRAGSSTWDIALLTPIPANLDATVATCASAVAAGAVIASAAKRSSFWTAWIASSLRSSQ